ncbi:carbohydrate kinase family protein [Streptomyces sp. NPDC050619]|uniref:carbohydrate kinase family protein n=1 Tax=Streptomyces sp. NPDC050619 TaxID=3157214 RepID=UPI003446DC39
MRIAVTGSVATDHLMVYPGRFTEQLVPDRLDRVSLSFLADSLDIRHGGVAANIAVGLARLGLTPVLAAAVGTDFADRRRLLEAQGVDTRLVRVSDTLHTARFVCTTDADQNQIATFYPGAMTEARLITLAPAARRGLELVLIGADDPEAMVRHTHACRRLGLPFAADPSQQLARLESGAVRELVDGARYLFTNAYEAALIQRRTGWGRGEVLDRVGTWISTLGADGVVIARRGRPEVRIDAVATDRAADPTGVGDAFRAGFLAGVAWDWTPEDAARLGCALATVVLESVGTQEYKLSAADLAIRMGKTYGEPTAATMRPRLSGALRPDWA